MRAEKEALENELITLKTNLKDDKFFEDIFKITSTYASFAKNIMDSGLKFANELPSSAGFLPTKEGLHGGMDYDA